MVTAAAGRHRRPSAPLELHHGDGMPFDSAEFLPAPVDTTRARADAISASGADPDWLSGPGGTTMWPPQWDDPPPALHPDHPSAPVPRVRVPRTPSDRPSPGDRPTAGNARARDSRDRRSARNQGHDTRSGFSTRPAPAPAPGPGPRRAAGPGRNSGQYMARPTPRAAPGATFQGSRPAQDYGAGHPPAHGNLASHTYDPAPRGDSRQSYAPAGDYNGGDGYASDPRLQPDPAYPPGGGYGPA